LCPSSDQNNYDFRNYGINEDITKNHEGRHIMSVESPASKYYIFDAGAWRVKSEFIGKNHGADNGNHWYIPGQGQFGYECSNKTSTGIADCNNGRHFHGINIAFA